METTKSIILFDSNCVLCNRWVQFILKNDKKEKFQIGALNHPKSKALFSEINYNGQVIDSIVLIENRKVIFKSQAVLRILKILGGVYSVSMILIIIPEFIRNFIYDFIASHRIKWFGHTDTCLVYKEINKNRFIHEF